MTRGYRGVVERADACGAHGGGLRRLGAVVAEVQSTVRRRRLREALALQGRTRATGAAGPRLATRIRSWCAKDTGFGQVAEMLSIGPELANLRAPNDIAQGALFAEGYLAADPVRERQLSDLLVVGFEAAPPDPVTETSSFDALLVELAALLERAETALLGDHLPEPDEEGYEMWQELASAVRAGVVRQLQTEVRSQLH